MVIYGVNAIDLEAGNAQMSEGRDIGLLQDITGVDAWTLWQADWRDTFVLDRDGRLVDIYNLTQHDLSNPANQDGLIALLDQAAGL